MALTESEVKKGIARLSKGAMVPEVWQSDVYEIETSEGTEYVPANVVGKGDEAKRADLQPYLSGTIRKYAALTLNRGKWCARLTMPGCLDSTDLTIHDSEAEAEAYLVETYDDASGAEDSPDGNYATDLDGCRAAGTHLVSVDDDGFCNECGHNDWEE
jgi:hypothetical protein